LLHNISPDLVGEDSALSHWNAESSAVVITTGNVTQAGLWHQTRSSVFHLPRQHFLDP